MPIYLWTKQSAVLITKAARYVVPAVIAAGAAAGAFIAGIFTGKKIGRKKDQSNRTGTEEIFCTAAF